MSIYKAYYQKAYSCPEDRIASLWKLPIWDIEYTGELCTRSISVNTYNFIYLNVKSRGKRRVGTLKRLISTFGFGVKPYFTYEKVEI